MSSSPLLSDLAQDGRKMIILAIGYPNNQPNHLRHRQNRIGPPSRARKVADLVGLVARGSGQRISEQLSHL